MADRVLSDALWAAVAPLLPGKEGDPGCHGRDNRLFLEAVFWIARSGSPWRDLPAEFGKWYTAYTRYHRWEQKGVWPRVVEELQKHGAAELRYDAAGLRWARKQGAALPPRRSGQGRAA
ncbi:transposase [Methylocystis sp. JAN1]|uniref:transposase n=1 Tax=Methylocystis sp. JAN1 TaxID=3397211 RepID=UPI003FA342E9